MLFLARLLSCFIIQYSLLLPHILYLLHRFLLLLILISSLLISCIILEISFCCLLKEINPNFEFMLDDNVILIFLLLLPHAFLSYIKTQASLLLFLLDLVYSLHLFYLCQQQLFRLYFHFIEPRKLHLELFVL